ncbi:hypothetical protein MMC07_005380 [Pseudocyphellaria aurata]|nr:hypothetical protein [Pseudocyphellaria aurata]
MHDPFPVPPPTFLKSLTTPIATALSLPTLPLHIHELLLATCTYQLICTVVAPILSSYFFPRIYPTLPRRTRLNWDVHVVSMVQSIVVNGLALWVMWVDEERGAMGWEERVWGYDGAGGMIQGFAAGYFLWDLLVCLRWVDVFGWGMLAHAVAALVVFSLGFRPFVNFYGPTFILYELSSPFLNMHWFFDKVHMTGSRAQWYNGILLLASFFSCRLVWGTYQSIRVYQDVWAGLHHAGFPTSKRLEDEPGADVMRFAKEGSVPVWLACTYLGSNVVLNTLNFYWFGKMIETVKKRFRTPRQEGSRGAAAGQHATGGVIIVEGTEMDGGEDEADEKSAMEAADGDLLQQQKHGAGIAGLGDENGSVTIDPARGTHVIQLHKTEVRKRKV